MIRNRRRGLNLAALGAGSGAWNSARCDGGSAILLVCLWQIQLQHVGDGE